MVPAYGVMISNATVRMIRDPAISVAVNGFKFHLSGFTFLQHET